MLNARHRLMTVDQQADAAGGHPDDGDPYIVFGYGSLIFRVRFSLPPNGLLVWHG